ncbi:helix-turn-helix domain-containing protein [Lutimonas zeaxanthinifaciens]|uniref:helix-turn-helix domain-containing protein n=1 Tax=Lutimonas zeaxanthinifaciens TaxID=3060215 RepID=UPI00265D55C7|nr:helix-turn-helix transcriptional regulator [Lutimonas sp. YSD2104]WKK67475.1 helix-turn-helix transcriptional regulator [Lutimonas sp. YSD2104]
MKQYFSIGELLIDYRHDREISQLDLSSLINVDVRTIQRWEKDITLIKPDKEKELAEATLLPYQLIRNLNASVPIPTFYDFRIRKYSLTVLNNELPDAKWLKDRVKEMAKRIRTIDVSTDMDILRKDLMLQKNNREPISRAVLARAVELLPTINLIIMDDHNNYSGHCIVLPLNKEAYRKLREREMVEADIQISDLANYKTMDHPVFFNYDITADCNDNIYYLAHSYLDFFKTLETDYEFCSFTMRYDSYEINRQLGLQLVWEDPVQKDGLGLEYHPRFYTGNFDNYFAQFKS